MRVKQFQVVNVPNTNSTQTEALVYALTEGGDLYFTDMCNGDVWQKMDNWANVNLRTPHE